MPTPTERAPFIDRRTLAAVAALVSLGTACSERGAPIPPAEAAPRAAATRVEVDRATPSKTEVATSTTPKVERTSVAEPVDNRPRIYAKARFAWVQSAPRGSPGWVGYISYGGSLPLRGTVEAARSIGSGACRTWYAVEPFGYVCEGDTATLDANDPVVQALARDAPHTDSPWPYEYGESLGVPRYTSIPSADEQRKREWDLETHLASMARARAGEPLAKYLTGVDLAPAPSESLGLVPMSPLVRDERKFVAMGSTVAYTRAFDVAGRPFVVASDQAILPRDRIKPYPRSEFHGVELGHGESLPLVFFRRVDSPRFRRVGERFETTDAMWPRLGHAELTGEKISSEGHVYWKTHDGDAWAREGDASVVEQTPPPFTDAGKGRRTWLDVSVLRGTLVAYEGDRPVFATLVSPGRGGVPFEGHEPLETASTPTGLFRVDGKFVTATMVSSTNDELVHTEVMYVQNFHGPHALHGAYWHDAWGEPKSGGCVNLSPSDSKWLFGWTEPAMPKGWYGLRSAPELGAATWVSIRR